MDESIVGHLEQDAGGGGDAGEGAGKHADEGPDVDKWAEDGDVGEGGEGSEGSLRGAEVLVELAESEGFCVAADEEEEADEDGGEDDGSGDSAEWVAGFVAEGGGGLEADEAEEGEYDAEADTGGGDGVELDLREVEFGAILEDEGEDDEGDHGDGGGLGPEHKASGGLDVSIGKVRCGGDGEDGDEPGRETVGGWDKDDSVVDKASDDGDAGGAVSEQERPACGPSGDGWERVGGVLVERAGRGGGLREAGDAESDEERGRGCKKVGEPGSVAGEREDEGDGERRRGGGGDGRDGLRDGFERREDVVAEAGVAGRGFVGGDDLERHVRLRCVPVSWDGGRMD